MIVAFLIHKIELNPKIITISEKKVVGMRSAMHRDQYGNIVALWKQFMPRKRELKNTVSEELIAMQIFTLQKDGQPNEEFQIWACAEVLSFNDIPKNMENYILPSGEYAVFLHKGMDASTTYQRIMAEWLPTSGFQIDDRPHFQVMGEKYKNGSPDSEEDFYVPIRSRN